MSAEATLDRRRGERRQTERRSPREGWVGVERRRHERRRVERRAEGSAEVGLMLRRTLRRVAAVLAVITIAGLLIDDQRSCQRQQPIRDAFRGAVSNLYREADHVQATDPRLASLLRARADEMRVPEIDCSQFPPGQ